MSALSVRHTTPALRTYAGEDALGSLSRELARTGVQRVMLVYGASIRDHASVLERVESALGDRVVARFEEAREHSPLPSVERARETLLGAEADAVIPVGGGSAVVTARAATILAAEGGDARDLCTRRGEDGRLVSPRLSAAKAAQWVVASTPTTAYAKAGAAVRDPRSGERLALFDPKARARGVVFDPAVAATAPPRLVRSSSLNAFAMAVDGLQSATDDPLAEALLRHALTMVREWIGRVGEETDGDVAVRLMFASLLAGQGSDHVGAGLAQALSHVVGPRSTVGNGVIEALLLPHTMRFNLGTTDEALRSIAAVLVGRDDASATAAIDAVEELLDGTGVPTRLRDAGVDRAAIPEIAAHALDDWAVTTVPRRADRDELERLLDSAW
ncbi:iron-containing alcohol dehydrogenase family protein [Nocardiopsis synnemataformans]|uniref:iron-containing alcohol dehydrogenase family protein n=1 Tax=Nocardiopsis synnemataformans TaxID=61305 RepID=UPI003EBE4F74